MNKFLLAGDKFMPEIHLRQQRFTYSACRPFTKNKERIKNLKIQEIQDIFIKTNQIKLVFNMVWNTYKAFNIAKNQKYDEY